MVKKIQSYEVIEKIGGGGMGIVYKCRHIFNKNIYAIKTLLPQYSENEEIRTRFRNEALILGVLEHPNIVKVYDYIETSNELIIVMEFIDGKSLDKLLKEEIAPLPYNEAINLFYQILDGIDYAHRKGIIHRDIKPSNILIKNDGTIKITDFGIAKLQESSQTRTGTRMGTLFYMSPEQVKGEKSIDLRTDIFSLGVTLFEMLTGKLPYGEQEDLTEFTLMSKIVNEPLPDPRNICSDIPEFLVEAIKKATKKDPSERFKSCNEFKLFLTECWTNYKNSLSVDKTMLEDNQTAVIEDQKNDREPTSDKTLINDAVLAGSDSSGYSDENLEESETILKIENDSKTVIEVDDDKTKLEDKESAKFENNKISAEITDDRTLLDNSSLAGIDSFTYSNKNLDNDKTILNDDKDFKADVIHKNKTGMNAEKDESVKSAYNSIQNQIKVKNNNIGIVLTIIIGIIGILFLIGLLMELDVREYSFAYSLIESVDHTSYVTAVAIASNGSFFVTAGGSDMMLKIWETKTGSLIRTIATKHNRKIRTMALSKDDNYLATGGDDGIIKIFKRESGEIINAFNNDFAVNKILFSSDSRYIYALLSDGIIRVKNIENGKDEFSLKDPEGKITCFALSEDGKNLYSGSEAGNIVLWKCLEGFQGFWFLKESSTEFAINNLAYSKYKNADLLAALIGNKLKVFNVSTKETIFEKDLVRKIYDIKFKYDPDVIRFFTCDVNNSLTFWFYNFYPFRYNLGERHYNLYALDISNSFNYLVAAGEYGIIEVWDLNEDQNLRYLIDNHTVPISSCVISEMFNGNYYLVCSKQNQILIWDYNKETQVFYKNPTIKDKIHSSFDDSEIRKVSFVPKNKYFNDLLLACIDNYGYVSIFSVLGSNKSIIR